jgi:CubicO group peptidase (beta-lactamase class C family)
MAREAADGFAHERFASVRSVFEKNLADGTDVGASFCATLEGETVVDLWGGYADEARARPWVRDTIINVYSTTKTALHNKGFLHKKSGNCTKTLRRPPNLLNPA